MNGFPKRRIPDTFLATLGRPERSVGPDRAQYWWLFAEEAGGRLKEFRPAFAYNGTVAAVGEDPEA